MAEINERPYQFVDKVVLAGNGRGSAQFQTGGLQDFTAHEIWIKSTGAVSHENLRDTAGMQYANASVDKPILSTMLNKPQTEGGGFYEFKVPLYLGPDMILYIDLFDTSGSSNTIYLLINGVRKVI